MCRYLILILILVGLVPEAAIAAPFLYHDALGNWRDPKTGTALTLSGTGEVIDSVHGRIHGKLATKPAFGANFTVAYANGRSCIYSALLSDDGSKLLLTSRGPFPLPPWSCPIGLFERQSHASN